MNIPQKLLIRGIPKAIGQSLSALVLIGTDFWLGADEGTSVARAKAEGGIEGTEWGALGTSELVSLLDLPGMTPLEKKKPDDPDEFPEVDAEGMAWDGRHLWIVASHSLKRTQAKPKKNDAENWRRLATIEADGNRYLLGRLPIDEQGDLIKPNGAGVEHCAARLPCDLYESDLLAELRKDELLARFLPGTGEESKRQNVPGKDNGLDIEGLAAFPQNALAPGLAGRLLVGLRGPVLRGYALVLEIRLSVGEPPEDGKPAMLQLQPIGARKTRRLAFQMGGLGVRDLCFEENGDLLLLAGPTMVLPWGVLVYRWAGAATVLDEHTDDLFIYAGELTEVLRYTPVTADERAESLCLLGTGPGRRLVIGYDSEGRFSPDGGLRLDAFPFPGSEPGSYSHPPTETKTSEATSKI